MKLNFKSNDINETIITGLWNSDVKNKYSRTKEMMEDITDMLIDLIDDDIKIKVEPLSNEIHLKMLSIGRCDMFRVYFSELELLDKKIYARIYDKIDQISDYMKGIDMNITIRLNLVGTSKTKYKNQFERYGLDINLDELKDFSMRRDFKNITIGIFPKNPILYESLPNQKTVDQLKMVAKLSKKTDIGNRLPNENGSNMRYIRNPIDNLESREDYDKHNKKFIPSWNLKHLLSPFKGKSKGKTKIKKMNESNIQNNLYDSQIYSIIYDDMIPDTILVAYLSYDDNLIYMIDKDKIDNLDSDNFIFKGFIANKEYFDKAIIAKDNYLEAKDDADSIRSSDSQYEDPSEWYTFDIYKQYYEEGLWNNVYWDYVI